MKYKRGTRARRERDEMEVRNPEPEEKRLTFGHSFVMEKLILRSPLPPVIGLGSTVVSRGPWRRPPILLSLLLLSCSLHGKEMNGRVGGGALAAMVSLAILRWQLIPDYKY